MNTLTSRPVGSRVILALFVCGWTMAIASDSTASITWKFESVDAGVTGLIVLDETDPMFVPNGTFFTGIESATFSDGTGFPTLGPPGIGLVRLGPDPKNPAGAGIEGLFGENTWKEMYIGAGSVTPNIGVLIIVLGVYAPPGGLEASESNPNYIPFDPNDPSLGGRIIASDGVLTPIPEPGTLIVWSLLGLSAAGIAYRKAGRNVTFY